MKRSAIRILFYVTLGCVTNIGITWALVIGPLACSTVVPVEPDYGRIPEASSAPGVERRTAGVELRTGVGQRRRAVWFRASTVDASPRRVLPDWDLLQSAWVDEVGKYGWTLLFEGAYGWPALSLRYELLTYGRETWPVHRIEEVRGGVALSPEQSLPVQQSDEFFRVFPLIPMLPGFIINTLFYAAIWFVLFFGFGFVKRTIRRKGGRCVRCGYDLRGSVTNGQDARSTRQDARSTGCPECGWNRAESDGE